MHLRSGDLRCAAETSCQLYMVAELRLLGPQNNVDEGGHRFKDPEVDPKFPSWGGDRATFADFTLRVEL